MDIFLYFFKDQVLALIIAETQRYALQHNDDSFAASFNIVLLKRFIGILIISSCSKFSQIGMYWSTNPTLVRKLLDNRWPVIFSQKSNSVSIFRIITM